MSETTIDEQFDEYIIIYRGLINKISDHNSIKIYAYFKQAREGNVNFERPSILNTYLLNRWKAWKKLEYMSSENAKKCYIKLIKEIIDSSPVS